MNKKNISSSEDKDNTTDKTIKKTSSLKKAKSSMQKSINSFVVSIDDKTNPVIGKILSTIFKWLTIIIFIFAIPISILLMEILFTSDSYLFTPTVVYEIENDNISGTKTYNSEIKNFDEALSYERIDSSIDDIWDASLTLDISLISDDNVFLETYNGTPSDSSNETPIFYSFSIFKLAPYANSSSNLEYWFNAGKDFQIEQMKTFLISKDITIDDPNTPDQVKIVGYLSLLDFIYGKSQTYSSYENPINSSADVKDAFREIFIPQPTKYYDNGNMQQIGLILSWTLVGTGIITSIIWFWFSKYSQVDLPKRTKKNPSKQKELENKVE